MHSLIIIIRWNAKGRYHAFHGDFLSGVRSKALILVRMRGVLLSWLIFLFAEMDFDLDRYFPSLSRIYKICCLGVLFSLSSRNLYNDNVYSRIKGCKKAYYQLILSSYFLFKHFLIKSLVLSEKQESIFRGLWLILLMSWSSLFAGHGVQPCNIS